MLYERLRVSILSEKETSHKRKAFENAPSAAPSWTHLPSSVSPLINIRAVDTGQPRKRQLVEIHRHTYDRLRHSRDFCWSTMQLASASTRILSVRNGFAPKIAGKSLIVPSLALSRGFSRSTAYKNSPRATKTSTANFSKVGPVLIREAFGFKMQDLTEGNYVYFLYCFCVTFLFCSSFPSGVCFPTWYAAIYR
jgi:hypothetical protein